MVLSSIRSFGYQARGRFWGGNENENGEVREIRVHVCGRGGHAHNSTLRFSRRAVT